MSVAETETIFILGGGGAFQKKRFGFFGFLVGVHHVGNVAGFVGCGLLACPLYYPQRVTLCAIATQSRASSQQSPRIWAKLSPKIPYFIGVNTLLKGALPPAYCFSPSKTTKI